MTCFVILHETQSDHGYVDTDVLEVFVGTCTQAEGVVRAYEAAYDIDVEAGEWTDSIRLVKAPLGAIVFPYCRRCRDDGPNTRRPVLSETCRTCGARPNSNEVSHA
jgi:hypothetical protein